MTSPREFFCRVPASLAKDASLSPEARLLYLVLCAHADARTGKTFLSPANVERLMQCGRGRRERAQRELAAAGWLRLERKPCAAGRWGARIYVVIFLRSDASARFHGCGQTGQYIRPHSQVGPSTEVPGVPAEPQPSPQARTEAEAESFCVTRPT